jgi:hypothetical protein
MRRTTFGLVRLSAASRRASHDAATLVAAGQCCCSRMPRRTAGSARRFATSEVA